MIISAILRVCGVSGCECVHILCLLERETRRIYFELSQVILLVHKSTFG